MTAVGQIRPRVANGPTSGLTPTAASNWPSPLVSEVPQAELKNFRIARRLATARGTAALVSGCPKLHSLGP